MVKMKVFDIKKLYSIFVILLFIFMFFATIPINADTTEVHTYKCTGGNNIAYKAGRDYASDPDDKTEFSSSEYTLISSNNSNCIDQQSGFSCPTHIFNFTIEESISDISQVNVFWRGYGGASSTKRDGFNIVITPYDGCVLRIFNNAIGSNSASEPEGISVTITDNFEDIIKNGHLELTAASAYTAGGSIGGATIDNSYLSSCYVELKIFYNSEGNTDEESQLSISAADTVQEETDFQVTISSEGEPVSTATVSFLSQIETTNSNGIVTFSAPTVSEDTIYQITATKTGYLQYQRSITVLNNDPITNPLLEINTPSSVNEEEEFDVTITAEESPVNGVLVNFSGDSQSTDINGIASFTAPNVETDTNYQITAEKNGYEQASDSITVTDTTVVDPEDEEELSITAPTSVYENTEFQITVTSEDAVVEDVTVTFLGNVYTTDENGMATLSAPEINHNATYTIYASKTGYTSDKKAISILNINIPETVSNGFINGFVIDQDKEYIENVLICAVLKGTSDNSLKCAYTNEQGLYNITLSPGTYNVSAKKNGYESAYFANILIVEKAVTRFDFSLTKKYNKSNSLLDYTLIGEIQKGSIVGSVDIVNDSEQITIYNEDINIELLSSDILSDQGLIVQVSGEAEPGTKIVLYIGNVANPEGIKVTFDDEEIQKTDDFESFFKSNNPNSEWVLTSSKSNDLEEYVVIVNIPHYSQHEIAITLEKILKPDNTIFVVFYIAFAFIISFVFVGFGKIRKRFF